MTRKRYIRLNRDEFINLINLADKISNYEEILEKRIVSTSCIEGTLLYKYKLYVFIYKHDNLRCLKYIDVELQQYLDDLVDQIKLVSGEIT